MRHLFFFSLVLIICGFSSGDLVAQNPLSSATATEFDLGFVANDAIYDSHRNLIYASTGSSDPATGNSIFTINASDFSVVSRTIVGSEPNQLAISNDGSTVLVGIDGARSVRSWSPETGEIGPLHSVFSFNNDPAVAEAIAPSPLDATRFVVSVDTINSNGSGDLRVIDIEGGTVSTFSSFRARVNSLAFVGNNSLIGFNNSTTGFDVSRFTFDGTSLVLDQQFGRRFSGFSREIEAVDGFVVSTGGRAANPTSLGGLGFFDGGFGAVEISGEDGTTYFFDNRSLRLFDNQSFLLLGSQSFDDTISNNIAELFVIGNNRLAYLSNTGNLGVIDRIPFTVTPSGPGQPVDPVPGPTVTPLAPPPAVLVENLSSASVIEQDFSASDAIYDPTRNVIYATVGGSDPATGNSIFVIDPNDLSIISRTIVGSSPSQLSISTDGSTVLVGINGARAVRSWTPSTGRLGALHSLLPGFNRVGVAEDIAATPGNPSTFVVSINDVDSTGSGTLIVVDTELGEVGGTINASFSDSGNSLGFASDDTLIGYSNRGFGSSIIRNWAFDGTNLERRLDRSRLGGTGTKIDVAGGLVVNTRGIAFTDTDFTELGVFDRNESSGVEISPVDNATYFFNGVELQLFDNTSFELTDSVIFEDLEFGGVSGGVEELFFAGNNRLAYITNDGQIGVLSNVPFSPEPALLGDTDLNGVVNFADIGPFVATVLLGEFQAEADIDQNGIVDFADIPPFIAIILSNS